MYGLYLNNNKERYFTIGDKKHQKFAFLPFKRQIKVIKVSQANLELEKLKSEQLNEVEISIHLTDKQESEISSLLYDHKEAFALIKEPLGEIVGHEVYIILNIERPYPPLLRRPAYPASSKSREALKMLIKELLDLGAIRKVCHNVEEEITIPVVVAWCNGKSIMVGDFRALNTYIVTGRCPIPKIQIALTQISQEVYLRTIDSLKGFHQNMVTPRARKYLRIISHDGVYEYLRMTFGINNEPSHFQIMMNEIFPEERSEGWLIIYIDEVVVCSKNLEENIYRLSRVLSEIQSVKMRVSLEKCHFGVKELKALGHVLSDLSLGIYKNKVAAVLMKPMPHKKKEMKSFLGFSGYYRQNVKDFSSIERPLYRLCDKNIVFEMTVDKVKAFKSL
ncbi:hypothetical protein O181_058888 [Austropuccinia psidii MF-1]|uniref:Reverse transcriptase domain-containing protein n=1 Tax=Austropuccinia psidii MF-1 TaxID=1389203 RepID=A0A9Q3HW08_9BASI|nr:hypothetical protein [Austropuccinia psidii MF-1]